MITAEEFAEYIKLQKPYLIEIEKQVQELDYGELDVRLSIRSKVCEKMTFIKSKTWLKKND